MKKKAEDRKKREREDKRERNKEDKRRKEAIASIQERNKKLFKNRGQYKQLLEDFEIIK